MFTANEMVKALTRNTETRNDFQDEHEKAAFATYLVPDYGTDRETAIPALNNLLSTYREYEGDRVTAYYAELSDFRANTVQL